MAVAILVGVWTTAAPAVAQKRVALVIGNSKYQHEPALANPSNDAREVAAALRAIRFDDVEVLLDADLIAMQSALSRLARKADDADLALIYYSGHGIEVDGRNYLIPTSAKLADAADVDFETVPMELVMSAADRAAKAKLVVLDACRNNPFASRMIQRAGRRTVGRGLAPVATATGTLVAYAARAGTTADDGSPGATSPFTSAFLKFASEPRLEVRLMLGKVRDEVVRVTRRQEPFTYGSLGGEEVYLNPAGGSLPVIAVPVPSAQFPASAAAEAWSHAKDSKSIPELVAFVRRFGDTYFGDLARQRIDELGRAAEQQRLAALAQPQQQEDARRKAEIEAAARKRVEEEETTRPDPLAALTPGSGRSARDQLANGRSCLKCPEMVVAPSGSFTMGSNPSEIAAFKKEFELDWPKHEGPQRTVSFRRPFAAGKFPVTFDEWDACVADSGCNGYRPGDHGWGRGNLPVINVSWDDAKAYITWLSRKTGKIYRLLSEAEREYVARAGSTTAFWWGTLISTHQANYNGNHSFAGGPKGEYRQQTVPVQRFKANLWGFYQVHGNVFDWVEDCWHNDYQGAPFDGTAWTVACVDSGRRVIRGGSWVNDPGRLRSAVRFAEAANGRYNRVGFRVARMLNP
jgi:formylglycine-generating enzyme required for sulfatase activity